MLMEFCRFLRSVKFVVRSLGRFLGRGVCTPKKCHPILSISQTKTPLK